MLLSTISPAKALGKDWKRAPRLSEAGVSTAQAAQVMENHGVTKRTEEMSLVELEQTSQIQTLTTVLSH